VLIQKLNFYQLVIPFKVAFSHSSASRNYTETIWVEVEGENGLTGYGESCPRSYVTGETLDTAFKFLREIEDRIIREIKSTNELESWVAREKSMIDKNPAAWCAIELALLDFISKSENKCVEVILGLPEVSGEFQYTAVLGDSEIDVYKKQLDKYMALGFNDYKIKISGDIEKDIMKLSLFRKTDNHSYRVRLDANNLWQNPGEVISYIHKLEFPVWAIEEPLMAGDYFGLAKIGEQLNVKIILDESFLKIDDFTMLERNPELWIINLRISKMGGLIRSKNIVLAAKNAGIDLIIGAQVGETSLLTRAALTIAQYTKKNLMAQEGAFGVYLLQDDVVHYSLMFGKKGILSTDELEFNLMPGFGLSIKTIDEYLM